MHPNRRQSAACPERRPARVTWQPHRPAAARHAIRSCRSTVRLRFAELLIEAVALCRSVAAKSRRGYKEKTFCRYAWVASAILCHVCLCPMRPKLSIMPACPPMLHGTCHGMGDAGREESGTLSAHARRPMILRMSQRTSTNTLGSRAAVARWKAACCTSFLQFSISSFSATMKQTEHVR